MGAILDNSLKKKNKNKPDVEVVKEKELKKEPPKVIETKVVETNVVEEKEILSKYKKEKARLKEMKKAKRKEKNSKLWRNLFTAFILVSLITGVVFTILEAI